MKASGAPGWLTGWSGTGAGSRVISFAAVIGHRRRRDQSGTFLVTIPHVWGRHPQQPAAPPIWRPMFLLSLALLTSPVDSAVVRDIEVAAGETLRTTSIGTGRPVVLIPGIFGGAFAYRKITGSLVGQGYRTIVVEPLGYGASSHPKQADYSFGAQTDRVARTLDQMGVRHALLVAQSGGAAIAFRPAIRRPDLVRGLLSIDGGPAESAATPGMKKAFKFGGGLVKLTMDESRLRHEVRREILKNSGDTSWVTDAVVRSYTAGQTADLGGSIDAFHEMAKSKENA